MGVKVGRPVAVKLLYPGVSTQPDTRRRFATEAAWTAHLEDLAITPRPAHPDPLRVATEAKCPDVADVAKVTIGVARGALAAQATVMETARRMGNGVSADQVIATLPPS